MLKAALAYANLGLSVFPMYGIAEGKCSCGKDCDNPGGHPACKHGLKDATTDEGTIREWFRRGGRNVALAPDDSWWALDVDGESGRKTLAGLESKHGQKLSDLSVAIAATPNGKHYLFKGSPEELKNWTGEAMGLPGLDVRKKGSSIRVYPSKQRKGVYRWVKNLHPSKWETAPGWLVRELRDGRDGKKEARRREREARRRSRKGGPDPIDQGPAIRKYLERALLEEAHEVENAAEHGRNHRLNEAAFSLGTLFHLGLSEEETYRTLYDAAKKAGLKPAEIDATIKSGFDGGSAHPRSVDLTPQRTNLRAARQVPRLGPPEVVQVQEGQLGEEELRGRIRGIKKDDVGAVRGVLRLIAKRDRLEHDGWIAEVAKVSGVTKGTLRKVLSTEAREEGAGDSTDVRDLIFQVGVDMGLDLFSTPRGDTFCRLPKSGRIIRCTPRGQSLAARLSTAYREKYGVVAPLTAMRDATAALQAVAAMSEPRKVYRQIAPYGDGVLIRKTHSKAIWIRPARGGSAVFSVIDHPREIAFFRGDPPQEDNLPGPEKTEFTALELVGQLFPHIADNAKMILITAWLFGTIQPPAPYPILCLYGEKGSGKSMAAQALKEIIDPEQIKKPEGEKRRDIQDLVATIAPQHIHVLDNLSSIDSEISDALCRISTGGNFSRRKLYTDGEKSSIYLQNPLVITSITEVIRRGDLLDRSIPIDLPRLAERRTEAEILLQIEELRPKLLWLLCSAASQALAKQKHIEGVPRGARMADFVKWVAAGAGEFLGFNHDDFVDAYMDNVGSSQAASIDSDPIVDELELLLDNRAGDVWEGSISELYSALSERAAIEIRTSRAWPNSPTSLGGRLRRLKGELLKGRGIRIGTRRQRDNGRQRRIWSIKQQKPEQATMEKMF